MASKRIIVFNFHHVETVPKHRDRKHITITPAGLKQFINTIRHRGMQIVSLRDIVADAFSVLAEVSRPVVLTFDDGYENFYQYGAPVLEEEKCPATVFIVAGKVAGTNDWDHGHLPEAERDALMSWPQMLSLKSSSFITFGSHGMMHRKFPELSSEALNSEINESFNVLSERLNGAFVPVMAYPWGEYSEETLALMAKTPYCYGMTTKKGPWDMEKSPVFTVPRYSVYFRDGNGLVLLAKLAANGLL